MTDRADLEWTADRLIACWGEAVLFEYVFAPALPRRLAPRPYFHPVRTLSGRTLTEHQPSDHPWHLGLAYSWPVIDRWNLWGGPTYVRDHGYTELENWGQIVHVRWDGLDEDLEWLGGEGERIAIEHRSISPPAVDQPAGGWWLDLRSDVRNVSRHPLRIGSPTTEGRPNAGYAGLAWRGVAELGQAEVSLEGRPADGDPMGDRSRWISLAGAGVTVALIEHPGNLGVPNRWFVRTEPFVLVTSSPVFAEPRLLQPGEALRLRHRLLVADGVWDAAAIRSVADGFVEVAV
jgi:Family of unknown function (DUF6807)